MQLTLDPNTGRSGNAKGITITANAGTLLPGRLSQLITIGDMQSTPAPDRPQRVLVTATIDILPPGSQPPIDLRPGGRLFLARTQGVNPPSQRVQVFVGSPQSMSFQTSAETFGGFNNWLSASTPRSTASATSLGEIDIRVAINQLPAGEYRGQVSVSFADGRTRHLPVVLVVASDAAAIPAGKAPGQVAAGPPLQAGCTPAKLIVAGAGLSASFEGEVGLPLTHAVEVADDCANPVDTASVLATFSSGDPAIPFVGQGGGRYAATWAPQNPADGYGIDTSAAAAGLTEGRSSLSGRVSAGTQPVLSDGGVVNAANFSGPISPGTIISAFGANLTNGVFGADVTPLPRGLGRVRLRIAGQDAPLFFLNGNQINAQVPFELTPNTTVSVLAVSGARSTLPQELTVTESSPGLFALQPARQFPSHVVALNQNNSVNTPQQPAAPGSVVTVFLTGIGPLTSPVPTGDVAAGDPLSGVTLPVTATIGQRPADVLFLGMKPGFVGLAQANMRVDGGVATGEAPVEISIGGQSAPLLNLSVGTTSSPPPEPPTPDPPPPPDPRACGRWRASGRECGC